MGNKTLCGLRSRLVFFFEIEEKAKNVAFTGIKSETNHLFCSFINLGRMNIFCSFHVISGFKSAF